MHFNNNFFQNSSSILENPEYQVFFKAGNLQETNNKDGGYVELSFLPEEDDKAYALKVMDAIGHSLESGFDYGDICIVVRKKKHAVALTDFLMSQSIPVVSSDSLLLSSSPKVQFLISLARFSLISDYKETNYKIPEYLSETKEERHDFVHTHLTELNLFLKSEYDFDIDKVRGQSLLDFMEHAIKVFDLAPDSDAHLLSFMDFVFDTEQQNGSDFHALLNNWELKSNTLSISTPENTSAVLVVTIHKSKGLEFPVVIFPYANSNIFEEIDPKLWIPVDPKIFMGFDELLISKKQEVKNYGEIGNALFEMEQQKLQLDAFNLLYVALTRAIHSLYIISYYDIKKDGTLKTDYYSGLFLKYLKDIGAWRDGVLEYKFGKERKYFTPEGKEEKRFTVPYLYSYKDRETFKIHTKAGMLWDTNREIALEQGNVYHHILENISTVHDLEPVLDKALKKGLVTESSYGKVRETLFNLIQHPKLEEYFQEDNIVYNERELLLSDGSSLIPDRVVLKEDAVIIIDYKTGKKSPKYKEQLESYANAYEEMGFKVENKIIAYINKHIIVEYI
ncbi:3'-5' exonuclease [Maribacter litopenaei]|uniref:3'-5' exonuclease n=1 Tax=Maribacter litopenaei TaxID=2976127 RepID=UPI003B8478F8